MQPNSELPRGYAPQHQQQQHHLHHQQQQLQHVTLDIGASELTYQFDLVRKLLFHPEHQSFPMFLSLFNGALAAASATNQGQNLMKASENMASKPLVTDDQYPSLSMASNVSTVLGTQCSQAHNQPQLQQQQPPPQETELKWKGDAMEYANRLILKTEQGTCLAAEEFHILRGSIAPSALFILSSFALVYSCTETEISMLEIAQLAANLSLVSIIIHSTDLSRTATSFLVDSRALFSGGVEWNCVVEAIRSESYSMRKHRKESPSMALFIHPTWKVWASRICSWSGDWVVRFERLLKSTNKDQVPTIYLGERTWQRKNVSYIVTHEARELNVSPSSTAAGFDASGIALPPAKYLKTESINIDSNGLFKSRSAPIATPLSSLPFSSRNGIEPLGLYGVLRSTSTASPTDQHHTPTTAPSSLVTPHLSGMLVQQTSMEQPPFMAQQRSTSQPTSVPVSISTHTLIPLPLPSPLKQAPPIPLLRAPDEQNPTSTDGSASCSEASSHGGKNVTKSHSFGDGHESSEGLSFACDDCGMKFRRNSNLSRHVELVHKKKRPFQCPGCDRVFGRVSNLERHIQVRHRGIKQCVCETCGWKFAQSSDLKKHIRRKHVDVAIATGLLAPDTPNQAQSQSPPIAPTASIPNAQIPTAGSSFQQLNQDVHIDSSAVGPSSQPFSAAPLNVHNSPPPPNPEDRNQ